MDILSGAGPSRDSPPAVISLTFHPFPASIQIAL